MVDRRNPERLQADHGPDASGWQPGDVDPNTEIVLANSKPGSPGIAVDQSQVVIGGVIVRKGSTLYDKMLDAGLQEDD